MANKYTYVKGKSREGSDKQGSWYEGYNVKTSRGDLMKHYKKPKPMVYDPKAYWGKTSSGSQPTGNPTGTGPGSFYSGSQGKQLKRYKRGGKFDKAKYERARKSYFGIK